MAEISKLSVGEALDKLRADQPASKTAQHDEKMDALDDEIQRLRAARLRLERDQRAGSTGDVQETKVAKPKTSGIVVAVIIVALAAAAACVLLAFGIPNTG